MVKISLTTFSRYEASCSRVGKKIKSVGLTTQRGLLSECSYLLEIRCVGQVIGGGYDTRCY